MTSDKTTDRASTQELFLMLQEAQALSPALEEIAAEMDAPDLPTLLSALMDRRGINAARLSELTLLSRSFTYQLCSGERLPGRDIVLRLALALKLSVEEAQRLLQAAGKGALYPRVRRDAIVIFCLGREKGLYETNELLAQHDEVPLL